MSGPENAPLPVPGLAGFRLVGEVAASGAAAPTLHTPYATWRDHSSAVIATAAAYHLRRARRQAGLPQWLLSARMGRDPSFICKTEAALRRLQLCEFLQLCALMGYAPTALLSVVVEQPSVREALSTAPMYAPRRGRSLKDAQ